MDKCGTCWNNAKLQYTQVTKLPADLIWAIIWADGESVFVNDSTIVIYLHDSFNYPCSCMNKHIVAVCFLFVL